jgi:adenylate cyclase, class 2
MKKEIEVKFRVENPEETLASLEKAGIKLSEPVEQDDTVFVNYDGDFNRFPKGANFLRIRLAKDKALLTLKRGDELASIERETEISDPKAMREALEFMGYHEAVRVKKVRRKGRLEQYEICLDDVARLGQFIELEEITAKSPEVAQQEMIEVLARLGIVVGERVTNGYDTLMYNETRAHK